MIRRLVPALALLASTAACGGGDKYEIGVILPMSGPQATYGEESWNGLQLAAEDARKAGAPVDFTLVLKDEKSLPQEASTQAKTLIEVTGVHVILGSVASSNTKQIAQQGKESGVPVITPASTNDRLTEDNPYLSRICFKDSFQGTVLAQFALQQGWKKAAVVVDQAQDYSTGLAENFRTAFEAGAGTVEVDYYKTGDSDFSSVIQNVAGRDPDVVFISGYYEDAGPMIRQAKSRWAGKPIIGGDGLDSPNFVKLIGDAGNPIYFSTHFASDAPDPAVQAFAKRYAARFGKPPGAMAALGYDVLPVLMDALARTKDPKDAEALAKSIAATRGVKGITGTISLDTPDRTPVKEAVIVRVDGGAFKYHATIQPAR